MVVSKLNNTAPIYIKKCSDEIFVDMTKSRTTNLGPKILENFKRVEPSSRYDSYDNSRMNVLHRSKNQAKIGKNIPNHNIMNILLENLIEEENTQSYNKTNRKPSNNVISNNMEKYITNTHACRDANKLPPKRISSKKILIPHRVDQKTSTTGLCWMPENQHYHKKRRDFCQSRCLRNKCERKCCEPPRINNKDTYKMHNFDNFNQCQSKSIIEYVNPNRFQSFSSDESIKATKTSLRKTNTVSQCKKFNSKSNDEGELKEAVASKSFVKIQIEKLNKMVDDQKGTKRTGKCNKQKKKERSISHNPEEANKAYINFINSAKNKIPKIPHEETDNNQTDDHDWSDNVSLSTIKFPKETRTAMERIMQSKSDSYQAKRKQSNESTNCRPLSTIPSENFAEVKPAYRKLSMLPCHKNLLCNRGIHGGQCVR